MCIALFILPFKGIKAQEQQIQTAQFKVANAIKKAKQENKKVLLMFKASWCGLCKKLYKTISDPSIKPYFDANYVIEQLVVFESKKNKHLEDEGAAIILAQYEGTDSGIPFWVILDGEGQLLVNSKLGRKSKTKTLIGAQGNIGCPATPEEVESFLFKLRKTAALTPIDLKEIASKFNSK